MQYRLFQKWQLKNGCIADIGKVADVIHSRWIYPDGTMTIFHEHSKEDFSKLVDHLLKDPFAENIV